MESKSEESLATHRICKHLYLMHCHKNESINSRWLVALIVATISCIVPFTIIWSTPLYFSSQNAYPNGEQIYSYINEALYIKDLMMNGSSFWDGSLGNQVLTEPLPSLFTAFTMIIFDKFGSPLCIVRWVIVFLASLIPITLYSGVYKMLLSHTQSIFVAILLFCIESRYQFGFELNSIFVQGIYGQLFGMVLMPIVVSKMYSHGIKWVECNPNTSALYLSLVYCCHIPSGLFCTLASFSAFITYVLTKEFKVSYLLVAAKKFFGLQIRVVLYLSWWVVTAIISYPYLKETCHDQISSFSQLILIITNGAVFDDKNYFSWFTSLVVMGLMKTLLDVFTILKSREVPINTQQYFSVWLLLMTVFVFMFTSLGSPFFLSMNNFIFSVHFCGLLLASTSLQFLFNCFSKLNTPKNLLRILLFIIISAISINNFTLRIFERAILVDVNGSFQSKLRTLQNDSSYGRILVHEKLGTGEPWDLINIPTLTGKPGILEACHESNDNPSAYFFELITQKNVVAEKFENFLRLYNIKYVAGYSSFIEKYIMLLADLESVIKFEEFEILKVNEEDEKFGFFNFIRLPGYVDGNMKNMHQAVVQSLDLYSRNVLLYLNPRHNSVIRMQSLVEIQTMSKSSFGYTVSNVPGSIVNWKLNGHGIDSYEAIRHLDKLFAGMSLYSVVIEQKRTFYEYHALVQVKQPSIKAELLEHLLFKLSYHPFWRCIYIPVPDTYHLIDYESSQLLNRTLTTVHYVTPNLMAVTLPEGRFHVVFLYRVPGILKIAAMIFIAIFFYKLFNFLLFQIFVSCFAFFMKF